MADSDDTAMFDAAPAATDNITGQCHSGFAPTNGQAPRRNCTAEGAWSATENPCTRTRFDALWEGPSARLVGSMCGMRLRQGGAAVANPGLRCAESVHDDSHAIFPESDAGQSNVAGECQSGYGKGTPPPRRTCKPSGAWDQTVTGSCERTPSSACMPSGPACCAHPLTPRQNTLLHVMVAMRPPALYCPGATYGNAEWPSNVPAGTYVRGDYCRPGYVGVVGRECTEKGQWETTMEGNCTRTTPPPPPCAVACTNAR